MKVEKLKCSMRGRTKKTSQTMKSNKENYNGRKIKNKIIITKN